MYLNQHFVSAVSVIMLAADAQNKEPTFRSVKNVLGRHPVWSNKD